MDASADRNNWSPFSDLNKEAPNPRTNNQCHVCKRCWFETHNIKAAARPAVRTILSHRRSPAEPATRMQTVNTMPTTIRSATIGSERLLIRGITGNELFPHHSGHVTIIRRNSNPARIRTAFPQRRCQSLEHDDEEFTFVVVGTISLVCQSRSIK